MKHKPYLKFEISEKDIEDCVAYDCQHHLGLRFVARQVSTPAGVIDVLACDGDVWYVIELKKDKVDANAVCQAMKYANYMNANRNKRGKRVFVPLVIGQNITSEIQRSVFRFNKYNISRSSYGAVYYTLFGFDPKTGLQFNYRNTAQSQYEDEHLGERHSYIDHLEAEIEHQQVRAFWREKEEEEIHAHNRANIIELTRVKRQA